MRIGRRTWRCVLRLVGTACTLVIVLGSGGVAAAAEVGDVTGLRAALARIDRSLQALDVRSDSLLAAEERVAFDLADLERQDRLGPVKRAQLSLFRQESERLAVHRARLESERSRLEGSYREVAGDLLPLLDPAIESAREAYQVEPIDSRARARRFREFEGLVIERKHLYAQLHDSAPLIVLDVKMEPEDSERDLERKVDLLADNRDLLARLLGRLSAWKRALEDDRAVLEDYRKLQEENDFFHTTDPTAPSHIRELPPGLGTRDVVPLELQSLIELLEVPAGGLTTEADYDRLIDSVERVETYLEEEILAMDENQQMIERELERRRRVE